jgi:geranylgeranyl diphosphate synthase type I
VTAVTTLPRSLSPTALTLSPVATARTPRVLGDVAAQVEAYLANLLDRETARWATVDPALREPFGALRSLVLAPAKRLRPAFCALAFVGAGGEPEDPAVMAAGAGLELLHACALIHDDIIDGSTTRRGQESVHAGFERRHAAAGWRGEGRRFGEGVALLTGDLAFAYANAALEGAPEAARRIFDELCLEVHAGQYLDLVGTATGEATPELARRIGRFKSAKYTVERPLHLGAALAAPDRIGSLEGPLSAYGIPIGEAFQLKDDLLGAFGDAGLTGKPVGDDFRQGKPTLLVALARRAATGDQATLLHDRLGATDLSPAEVSAIQAALEATGARQQVEQLIEALVGESVTALDRLPFGPPARRGLADLARFVAGRDR